jgi:hypothetical protein
MSVQKSSAMWIWVLVVALIILHQDNWLWDNGYLVFGFMPVGLFFHACISIAAALTWYLATKFAWPHELEVAAADAYKSDKEREAASHD